MKIKFTHISLALALLGGGVETAHALSDFTGYYDKSSWTTTDTASG